MATSRVAAALRCSATHDAETRTHHRHRRSGRIVPRRAPPRRGVRGVRRRAAAGLDRRSRTSRRSAIDLELMQADVLDELSLMDVLAACRPHEVYNLASPSFVPMSWQQPVLTAEFAAVGCTALLEAIRRVDDSIRFYQASSSEIFGEPREVPQVEETPLRPGHAVRRREGLRALHHAELPAALRAPRVLRDPLQPRVAAAAARVRDAQDRECGGRR